MEFAKTALGLMTPTEKLVENSMSFSTVFAAILLLGWLGSRLAAKLSIPNVLGMLGAGILLGLLLNQNLPKSLAAVEPFLKNFALIVILLRAGLGINRKILKQTGTTAILLSIIPCLLEGSFLFFAFRYIYDFSFAVAGMSAFLLSAVSPAVIVPSMLNFKELGYSANRQVPTIVLAGASLDDVFAITMFSIFSRIYRGGAGFGIGDFMRIPFSILMGILLGMIFGYVIVMLFRRVKQIRATEKVIVLLGLCLVMIEIGDFIGIASFLGAMTIGYMLFEQENRIAHEISNKLSKIWIFAELLLFVLIGMSLNPVYLLDAGLKGLALILLGLLVRSLGVMLSTLGSGLNRKERLFCVISYLPKATVQAALGSIPLAMGIAQGNLILALAVMSIMISAPLGLILIRRFGPYLLGEAG
jgi:solute carrier family 9B (sodium/hydrogen exchanger), member 1/2